MISMSKMGTVWQNIILNFEKSDMYLFFLLTMEERPMILTVLRKQLDVRLARIKKGNIRMPCHLKRGSETT